MIPMFSFGRKISNCYKNKDQVVLDSGDQKQPMQERMTSYLINN